MTRRRGAAAGLGAILVVALLIGLAVVGQQEYADPARAIAGNAHGSLWIAPGGHTEAPVADPAGYRQRVVDFLIHALVGRELTGSG